MEEWVLNELQNDGSITWKEINKALKAWEKETGQEVSKDARKLIKAFFRYADIDDNQEAT